VASTGWEAESEKANCREGRHHNDKERKMTTVKTQLRHGISEITITYPGFPFEGIFSGGGDGDGGYVCFICGRAMDRGEAFTCVSRLLETCEGSEGKPTVIEAVASLQVCLPCTLLCAHHRLKWAHNPKLTGFEICGFYTYARLLTETMNRRTCDTRVQSEFLQYLVVDSPYLAVELDRVLFLGGTYNGNLVGIITDGRCLRCAGFIDSSEPHIAFEISIHIPKRGVEDLSNIWELGSYCEQCSNQLLPLCDRVW